MTWHAVEQTARMAGEWAAQAEHAAGRPHPVFQLVTTVSLGAMAGAALLHALKEWRGRPLHHHRQLERSSPHR
jgi:hypothetical protein